MSESVNYAIGSVKVNGNGRIVLPAFMRKQLGIEAGSTINIQIRNQLIQIWTGERKCSRCSQPLWTSSFIADFGICRECFAELISDIMKGGELH